MPISIKDERGTPDRRGFPDRTVQPRPASGHGAIFCLNRGSVRSGVKKTGWVGNGVVFSRCGYFFFFFFRSGSKFWLQWNNIHQRIKEIGTMNNKCKHKSWQLQNHSKNQSLTSLTLAALLFNNVEPILFVLWMMFWFISPIKVINCFTGRYLDGLLFAKLQLFVQCSIMDGMELSQICCRRSWYRSGPFNVGYIGAWIGYLRVGPDREKFHHHILQSGRKNKNMAGRSGIGVLVTGFNRVGAFKKHAPLIFNFNICDRFWFCPSLKRKTWNTIHEIIS